MTHPPPPPTLCEVTYDQNWDLLDLPPPPLPPPLPRFRAISSAKSHQSFHSLHSLGRGSGAYPSTPNSVGGGFMHGGPPLGGGGGFFGGSAPPPSSLVEGSGVNSSVNNNNNINNAAASSYCDYLKSYYWDQPVYSGGPSSSPSLPARPGTSYSDALPDGVSGRGDRSLFALPSLSRVGGLGGPPGDDAWGEEGGRKEAMVGKLKWVDALNAWVPEKPNSQKRGKDDLCRKLQRKAYSSPLYDPETLRKSRTVRFEAPRTVNSSPQPIILPEQIDVPLAQFEDDTTVLEGESFELVQAREELQEQVEMAVLKDSTPPVDQVLDPPTIVNDPVVWPEVVEERVLTPEPEVVEVEVVPEEEPVEETPAEDTESKPAATSSPRQPIKEPSPRPSPINATIPIEEPPTIDSSSPESLTPPPTPPPVVARRPTIVEPEEAEPEKTKLVGLMSRLSSLQRAKPKPKPKKGRPPVEKTPRQVAPKPKPVEKPPRPAPAAPQKPKQPKAPAPKPVKEPRPPKPKPQPKEKKIVPKPAPKPPPPVKEKKEKPKPVPVAAAVVVEEEPVDKPVPLPISPPEEVKPPEPPVEEPPPPPPPPVTRAPVKKKEKLPPPPPRRRTPTPPPKPPTPVPEKKERDDWIFGSDDEEKKEEGKEKEVEPVTIELPTLPPSLPTPNPVASPRGGARRGGGRSTMNLSVMAIKSKPRWGQKQKDTSLSDEEERERLAEERRRRHALMMDRNRMRRAGEREGEENGGPNFEDYGFLAKYCILNPATTEKYRYTFEHLDEGEKGYLTEEETAYGLRAVNPSLSVMERTYLFRILEMAGHKMKMGTDFKLFSILAALSQRVSKLDEWARKLMAEMDYRNLEMKLFLCKTLWECNVDPSNNTISLDQLIVELRAGGVSPQHEKEVRTKLADHRFLDFFDFLMYVPLFIMIHETVVTDPLSVSRTV